MDSQREAESDLGVIGAGPHAGEAPHRRGVRRRRARTVLATVAVAVAGVVAAAVVAVHGGVGTRDLVAGSVSCAELPNGPDVPVPGVTAALTDVPSVISSGQTFQATVVLSRDAGQPPVTVDLVGGDSAELFLVGDGSDLVGSGNFAHLAVGPVPRTIDDRGLPVHAAGGAFRCADLDDPSAQLQEPLPPGEYHVEGLVRTDGSYLLTPGVPVHVE